MAEEEFWGGGGGGGGGGGEGEGEVDDWDSLEAPYELVLEALPKAKERDIVDALRRSEYDADMAILYLQKKKKQAAAKAAAVKQQQHQQQSPPGAPALRIPSGASSLASSSAPTPSPTLAAAAPAFEALPALTPAQAAHLAAARPHLALITLGHVDAGKSTLLGRLLYDLGLVGDRALSRVVAEAREAKKASFAFAWLFDSGREERARGVTVDVGTNHFAGARTDFTLLDAPGHREYVPNMIAGVAQADAAILVVDATPGEFEAGMGDRSASGGEEGGEAHGGQTREHAHLARALGVAQLVVAVNKMDGCGWSQARFEAIRARLGEFLVGSAGFQASRVAYVPVSGLRGINLVHSAAQGLQRAAAAEAAAAAAAAEAEAGEPATPALAALADFLGYGSSRGSGGGGSGSGGSGGGGGGAAQEAQRAQREQALQHFCAWYKGPTLLACLEALRIPPGHGARGSGGGGGEAGAGGAPATPATPSSPAPASAPAAPAAPPPPLRFLVADSYAAGSGGEPCVCGRMEGGFVAPGMSVQVWPGGARGKVKSVSRWGASVPVAGSGDCVDLVLGGLGGEGVGLGPASVLAWAPAPAPPVLKFKALLFALPASGGGAASGGAAAVCRGQQFLLHAHCAAEPCVVSRLLRTVEAGGSGATLARRPRVLPAGATAVVRIVLARPRVLAAYAECRRLGSFVLRYHGVTVAVGKVVKVSR